MRNWGVEGAMPSLPRFQLFRCTRKNPRGVTYHDMLIEPVVHHDLPNPEIGRKCSKRDVELRRQSRSGKASSVVNHR